MSRCEYDPEKKAPATAILNSNGFGGVDLEWLSGCENEATISLGSDGKWHLCDSCAALPEFKKYRKRTALKPI